MKGTTLQDRLKAMLEGTYITEAGEKKDDQPIGEDAVTDDMMAEATLAMILEEAESYAIETAREFIMENSHLLVRDRLLTEDAAGQSFTVLSRQAQRSKAENLLKMQMARKAKDPRYMKVAALRRTVRRLTKEIHNDSRYNEARTITMRRQFRFAPDAKAYAAKRTQGMMKLS